MLGAGPADRGVPHGRRGRERFEDPLRTERDPNYEDVHDCSDLPVHLLEEIQHFFDMYKILEPGKSTTTAGYEGRDAAWREIEAAQERYRQSTTTL